MKQEAFFLGGNVPAEGFKRLLQGTAGVTGCLEAPRRVAGGGSEALPPRRPLQAVIQMMSVSSCRHLGEICSHTAEPLRT